MHDSQELVGILATLNRPAPSQVTSDVSPKNLEAAFRRAGACSLHRCRGRDLSPRSEQPHAYGGRGPLDVVEVEGAVRNPRSVRAWRRSGLRPRARISAAGVPCSRTASMVWPSSWPVAPM